MPRQHARKEGHGQEWFTDMFGNTTHPEEVQKKLHTLPFTFGRFECIDFCTFGKILLLTGNLMDKCVNVLVI